MTMLELKQLGSNRRPTGRKVLINTADIESVQPLLGDYRCEVGSVIRTRSGATHDVAEDVAAVKKILQRAMKDSDL